MTIEEAIERYSHIPLMFKNYYKYSFMFVGIEHNIEIVAMLGGNHSDIYKMDIDANEKMFLQEGQFFMVVVKDINTDDEILIWNEND